jgi:hypothetical protein
MRSKYHIVGQYTRIAGFIMLTTVKTGRILPLEHIVSEFDCPACATNASRITTEIPNTRMSELVL